VGFKKEFKGRGYASALLDTCIEESRQAGKHGVAVVARKGSFMAGSALFLKKGFMTVDRATPDFELLALKCRDCAPDPSFKIAAPDAAARGLTIMRSPQCPYSVKNVDAIMQTAKGLGLPVSLRELPDAESAQRSPCAFGAFCIMHDNEIISHHPISNTRFTSIMKSRLSR
jgi:predicted GNAT family acetyltransferase